MKYAASILALLAIVVVGCQKKTTTTAGAYPVNDSVTDIGAPAGGYHTGVQPVQPIAPQPVVYDSMTTHAPAMPETPGAIGGAYTVKQGDTLYSIARQRYGEGKQWTRIADANPGLDPTKLRVGQTINIP